MINFNDELEIKSTEKTLSPLKIYEGLDRSAMAAGPLRPSQEEILREWFEHRYSDKDIIVKMHTGEGKTLVGLLMLMSRLNAGDGPCMYVCPTIQLAKQVAKDADKFGIPYCTLLQGETNIPLEYTNGDKLLITYVQKVFNGRTLFGLDGQCEDLGTILFDDSHSCIDSIRNAFTMIVDRNCDVYSQILNLFRASLANQGEGDLVNIETNDFCQKIMPVPYWDWIRRKSDVLNILMKCDAETTPNVYFPLQLDQNIMERCTAYVTGNRIEITPDYLLINRFRFLEKAKYRILMSATTQDDSFFIKGFKFSEESIKNPLKVNKNNTWSGEKMILFPSLIDGISIDNVRNCFAQKTKPRKFGIVALTPSTWSAVEFYRDTKIYVAANIEESLNYLASGDCSELVVYVNKYDGIDLADNMCRILILDSLPIFDNLADRYEQLCRPNNHIIEVKIAQKIEQGLGRSVRSEKDYSAILIVGSDLVRFIKNSKNQKYFSAQTKCQIEVGDIITKLAQREVKTENPINILFDTINQCLTRDNGWKAFYQQKMTEKMSTSIAPDREILFPILRREASFEECLRKDDIEGAIRQLNHLCSEVTSEEDKGWYQQLLAKYMFLLSEKDYSQMQYNAHYNNPRLLLSDKTKYRKLGNLNDKRLDNIKYQISRFDTFLDLKLYIDDLVSALNFGVDSNAFEEAIFNMGKMLGYESQRPDQEINKGPDNLWRSDDGTFFLIECKNEVELTRDSISKSEAGQMSNHVNWFKEQYSGAQKVYKIWVHPTNKLNNLANIDGDFYVITNEKLDLLKQQFSKFFSEFSAYNLKTIDTMTISKLLSQYSLTESNFVARYALTLKK